jgi:hypothetical protein
MGALGEGGVNPRVPFGLYDEEKFHIFIDFKNSTVEQGAEGELIIDVSYKGGIPNDTSAINAHITLEIYGWAKYGDEGPLPEGKPKFRYFDAWANATIDRLTYEIWGDVPSNSNGKLELRPLVVTDDVSDLGFYRVSIQMYWETDSGIPRTARSMGTYGLGQWEESIELVRDGQKPIDADFLITEAGFNVVPEHFDVISAPNKVPDFGDFTTPVIRPGESGRYNFTVTNRYDEVITDVTVTVEFYMWATIEDAKPIEDIEGPPPKVKGEGGPLYDLVISSIEPGASVPVVLTITTSDDTDKGTYFVRHRIEFTYEGVEFQMSSRGYFTWDQWEGFDYSNLWYQLDGNAGIVPDSSFSVKDPVPLWPLATLIALCVLFGALAVVFYLAEEHGDQYPRLKKGLQRITGRWEQRKRLMHQRMEELRGEDREDPGEEEDGDDPGT